MKMPAISSTDPEIVKVWKSLQRVLSALSIDNFQTYTFQGTTSASADSSAKFRHGLTAAPRMWFALEGDVYIPSGGLGTSEIDVRSTKANETFKILLIR